MVDENDGLVVPVGVTLNRLTRQLAQAEQRMVRTAQRSEQQFRRSNRNIGRSFDQVTTATRGLTGGNGLRMVSLQLSQVGQQGAVTGDYLRALSIQMPDILLAFGTFGALAGGAAAALTPFIANLITGGKEAATLEERLTSLKSGVDALREATKSYTVEGIEELIEKYGELNAEIDKLIERQARVAGNEARDAAREAVQALEDEFSGFLTGTPFGTSRANALAGFLDLEATVVQVDNFGNKIRTINPEVQEFLDLIEAAGSAATFEEQADAIAELLTRLEESEKATGEFYNELVGAEDFLRQAVDASADLEAGMARVEAAAAGATSEVSQLAAALAAARAARLREENENLRFADTDEAFGVPVLQPRRLNPEEVKRDLERLEPRERRGGLSDAERDARRERNEQEREAEQIYDATRTAAERYADSLARLNELQAADLIDAETYARARADLEGLGSLLETTAGEVRGAFSDVFDGIVRGSDSAADAIQNLAQNLASLVLEESFFRLLAGLAPGTFGAGGTVPLVGARASGGPVSAGQPYLVGERGPELIVPRAAGTVLTAQQTAGLGGGGTVVNVVNNGPGKARVERSRGPGGVEVITAIVEEEMSRGRFDGPLSGRYRARPAPVRRG